MKKRFSFIDYGNLDFIRDHNGETLIKTFLSWEDADEFVMNGGLEDYGWTNEGTRKWCWDED